MLGHTDLYSVNIKTKEKVGGLGIVLTVVVNLYLALPLQNGIKANPEESRPFGIQGGRPNTAPLLWRVPLDQENKSTIRSGQGPI